jgi:Ni2+-binding GTPase involved in maturation of urease and hydrogenase
MKLPRLIFVGGFLGAGKTTLLWQAAQRLAAQGRRVGLVTNDQAPDLVDTHLLAQGRAAVREVSGSCFCCNFPGLICALESLGAVEQPDVIVAEPVGSCTDLSATILQPLKDKFQNFDLAPLSVVVDPKRLHEALSGIPGLLHASAAYILRKQMEEADVLLLNKCDLLTPESLRELHALLASHYPQTPVRDISAVTNDGVDAWLDAMLRSGGPGGKILAVDYDTYAEGEAVLGWLNATASLACPTGLPNWRGFCERLLAGLQKQFQGVSREVGHVKALLEAEGGSCVANLTRLEGAVVVRGDVAPSSRAAELVLNARVELSPQELEQVVRAVLRTTAEGYGMTATITSLRSLSPGRPQPTHRYTSAV